LEILRNIFGNVCYSLEIYDICEFGNPEFNFEDIATGELFYFSAPELFSYDYINQVILVGHFSSPSDQKEYYWFLDVEEQETAFHEFNFTVETNYDELLSKMRTDLRSVMNNIYPNYDVN
jgi:hypothetical protein